MAPKTDAAQVLDSSHRFCVVLCAPVLLAVAAGAAAGFLNSTALFVVRGAPSKVDCCLCWAPVECLRAALWIPRRVVTWKAK